MTGDSLWAEQGILFLKEPEASGTVLSLSTPEINSAKHDLQFSKQC